MLQYFNVTPVVISHFNVALFNVAIFFVALFNVALCQCSTI